MGTLATHALQANSPKPTRWGSQVQLLARPLAFGLLAAAALLGLYLGLITLAQGWSHALVQLAEDRFFVGAIVSGFGSQVGLFSYLRALHEKAAVGGLAAS